jgi:hypothetical protein
MKDPRSLVTLKLTRMEVYQIQKLFELKRMIDKIADWDIISPEFSRVEKKIHALMYPDD